MSIVTCITQNIGIKSSSILVLFQKNYIVGVFLKTPSTRIKCLSFFQGAVSNYHYVSSLTFRFPSIFIKYNNNFKKSVFEITSNIGKEILNL